MNVKTIGPDIDEIDVLTLIGKPVSVRAYSREDDSFCAEATGVLETVTHALREVIYGFAGSERAYLKYLPEHSYVQVTYLEA